MELLTPRETAEFLRVSRSAIYKWIASGTLKTVRVQGEPRISKDWLLNEFIKEEK